VSQKILFYVTLMGLLVDKEAAVDGEYGNSDRTGRGTEDLHAKTCWRLLSW
jgi:hypothetical protein